MAVGEPMDILQGHDLVTPEGQKLARKTIKEQEPDVSFMGIPCAPWSQIQNINDPAGVEAIAKSCQTSPEVLP
jgi:hypothetical protein